MSEPTKFICSCCGKELNEWPSWGYKFPDSYAALSEIEKDEIAEISDDFCIIRHPDQTDHFIRCTLNQKVIDHCQDLEYGLWVSLSEKSFEDYRSTFENDNHEATYFGWLCNGLPDYNFNESIPTTIYTRTGNQRPDIVPHQEFDHPFVRDYYDGITKSEAERRIRVMLGGNEKRTKRKK